MSRPYLSNDITVNEALATLQRSSLPTIVIEGRDDLLVYRKFEARFSACGLSVFPAGGRNKLLEIFARRNEVPGQLKLLFIADQDVWVNTGIPPEFVESSLLFTSGFSIENDIFMDGQLARLMDLEDRRRFDRDMAEFVEWYTLALRRHLLDDQNGISNHPNQVLDPHSRPTLLALDEGEAYPTELRDAILEDYARLLRGKSLFALLVRNISMVRHSDKSLLDQGSLIPGPCLSSIIQRVSGLLSS